MMNFAYHTVAPEPVRTRIDLEVGVDQDYEGFWFLMVDRGGAFGYLDRIDVIPHDFAKLDYAPRRGDRRTITLDVTDYGWSKPGISRYEIHEIVGIRDVRIANVP